MKKGRLLAALMSIVLAVSTIPAKAMEEKAQDTSVSEDSAYSEDELNVETISEEAGLASKTYEFKYGQTEARKMLSRINTFRKSDDAWYWNENDSDKVKPSNLADYAYDYGLEKIAMLRAIEIVHKFSHDRPNGNDCFSTWSELGYAATGYRGENIAYGYSTEESVFIGWREDNDKYSGQGHRRNMLSSNFKYIGIGHVIYKGTHYWVQDFGSVATGEAENTAADSDYKAVIDDNGKVTVTKVDGTEPEDPKPDDPQPDDPQPDEPTPDEPTPEDEKPITDIDDLALVNKEKYDLSAIIRAKLGNSVPVSRYATGNKAVVAVNAAGVLTAKNKKTDEVKSTYVYCYVLDGQGKEQLGAKIKVSVYKPVFKFSNAELTHAGMSLDARSFISNIPENKKIRFTIPESKQQIMTINESTGMITAGEKNGTVKISAYIGEGDKAAKYTAELKVKKPKLKETLKIKNGKSKKLTLKNVSSFNKDKIQWRIEGSAAGLTTTNKNNVVKLSANAIGTATVIAVLDGSEYKTVITVE